MTLATAMYWTGIDPMTKTQLFVAKEWKDRKIQQALLQPHKPQHRQILVDYNRERRQGAQAGKQEQAARQGKVPMHPSLKREMEGGVKQNYAAASKPLFGQPKFGKKRSIVEPPTEKMGKKLLLDSR